MSILKRVILTAFVILLVAWGKVAYNYAFTEKVIDKYEKEDYESSLKSVRNVNFIEPYVALYDEGNLYYKNYDYKNAIKMYKEALKKNPTDDIDCKIRINLALSMVRALPDDYDSADKIEDSIKELKEARDILIENGCASDQKDEVGHNETAQQLKEELDKLIKKLERKEKRNEKQQQNGDGDDDKQNQQPEDIDDSKEGDIKKELMNRGGDAINARSKEERDYKDWDSEWPDEEEGIW